MLYISTTNSAAFALQKTLVSSRGKVERASAASLHKANRTRALDFRADTHYIQVCFTTL